SVHQRLQGINTIFRRLHGNAIGDAVLRVEPERGRGLETAAERYQQVLRNIALLQADLLRPDAIDREIQRRRTHQLLHMHIYGAGHVAQTVGDALRQEIVLRVLADDLNVDRGGQAEVENLADDVRRLEEELHAREQRRQLLAQLLYVLLGGAMLFLVERNQDLRVRRADGPTGAV